MIINRVIYDFMLSKLGLGKLYSVQKEHLGHRGSITSLDVDENLCIQTRYLILS